MITLYISIQYNRSFQYHYGVHKGLKVGNVSGTKNNISQTDIIISPTKMNNEE